jgi:hypothetical protein
MMLLNDEYPLEFKDHAPADEPLTPQRKKQVIKMLQDEPVVLLGFNAAERHSSRATWTTPVTLLADAEVIARLTKGHTPHVTPATAILPECTEVVESDGCMFRYYATQACHSYHETADGINIASIPTTLQFYFAYVYSGIDEDKVSHILCVAQRLMELAHHADHRRFKLLTPTDCLGDQPNLHDMLKEKTKLYGELSKNRASKEFLTFFFSYSPTADKGRRTTIRKQLQGLKKMK